jgi:hypothetical protein
MICYCFTAEARYNSSSFRKYVQQQQKMQMQVLQQQQKMINEAIKRQQILDQQKRNFIIQGRKLQHEKEEKQHQELIEKRKQENANKLRNG